MVQFTTILSSALLTSIAIAQTPNASFNQTVINQVANEITANQKAAWCNAQSHACNVLCNNGATNNTCSVSDLSYNCTCTNGSAPAFQYYNPDMLTNICNQYLGDCLATTAGSADAQDNCKATIICGNSSVDAYANSSAGQAPPSSSGSPTTSSTSMASGISGSTSSPSPSHNAAAAALKMAQGYATPIFATILLGAFGLGL